MRHVRASIRTLVLGTHTGASIAKARRTAFSAFSSYSRVLLAERSREADYTDHS